MNKDQLREAFHNDVRLLNETRLGIESSSNNVDVITWMHFLGGVFKNTPESFTYANDVWSVFAIPSYSGALSGTEYESLTTLQMTTSEEILEACLEVALSQGKGLITYFPSDVSRVKTLFRNWSLVSNPNPLLRAGDSASNIYKAVSTANDIFFAFEQMFGLEDMRARLYNQLHSNKKSKGIATGARRLDYALFLPENLDSANTSFRALKTMNDALKIRLLPHVELPETVREFDIRAGINGYTVGEYMVMLQRDLVSRLRKR